MRILFIYNGTEQLGIEYLSSVLKSNGHETHLLFDAAIFSGDVFINIDFIARRLDITDKIVAQAIAWKPDLIGFSAYTGNFKWSLRLADAIKKIQNVPIVFGGIHTTAVPEKVLSHSSVDFVICGEGELALLELVEHIKQQAPVENLFNINNLGFISHGLAHINPLRPYQRDLDAIPFPDKKLFLEKSISFQKSSYLIMTGRGCPYHCDFCSNSLLQTLYENEKIHLRRRSPENVVAELVWAKNQWDFSEILFMDDVFTVGHHWLEQFVPIYMENVALPFICFVHPLAIDDAKASLLKKCGCRMVLMGVQSGSEHIRHEVFNRKESNDRVIRANATLRRHGLSVAIDHIFGAPGEKIEDIEASVALYRQLQPDMIHTFWLTYYPKTTIIGKALKSGAISEAEVLEIENGVIGYTHAFGSVRKEHVAVCKRYELVMQLIPLVKNKQLFSMLLAIVYFVPMKKWFSYFFRAVNEARHNRAMLWKRFSLIFFSR